MGLVVEQEWSDRYDDRVVGLSDGAWATATDRALTIWRDGSPLAPIVTEAERAGPLTWFAPTALIGWGPSVVSAGAGATPSDIDTLTKAALAEVGDVARRHFGVQMGAVGDDGRRLVALVRRRPPRVRAAAAPAEVGPASRLAVFGVDGGALEVTLADDLLDITTLAWGHGPLLVGCPGRVLRADERTWHLTPSDLPSAAAPRALAVDDGGQVAAALADGTITTWSDAGRPREPWSAHNGPVRSVAWSPGGMLASGGEDGWLRVWAAASSVAHEIAPAPTDGGGHVVEALAWLDDRRVVAKIGGQAGKLALIAVRA